MHHVHVHLPDGPRHCSTPIPARGDRTPGKTPPMPKRRRTTNTLGKKDWRRVGNRLLLSLMPTTVMLIICLWASSQFMPEQWAALYPKTIRISTAAFVASMFLMLYGWTALVLDILLKTRCRRHPDQGESRSSWQPPQPFITPLKRTPKFRSLLNSRLSCPAPGVPPTGPGAGHSSRPVGALARSNWTFSRVMARSLGASSIRSK